MVANSLGVHRGLDMQESMELARANKQVYQLEL